MTLLSNGLLLAGLGAVFLALFPWSIPLAYLALVIWRTS